MRYVLFDGVALMGSRFDPAPGQKQSSINFDSPINGVLLTSNTTFPVVNGEARVPTRLYAEAKEIFLKESGKKEVVRLQTPNGDVYDIIQAIAKSVTDKNKKIDDLEKRVKELEQYCLPNDYGLF